MRTSAKVFLWGYGICIPLALFSPPNIMAASSGFETVLFLAMRISGFIGAGGGLTWLFNVLIMDKIMDKTVNKTVNDHSIKAVNSTVAVANNGATIDQSTTINNSGQIGSSISELRSLIYDSDLAGNDKKYANLLLEGIESKSSESDKGGLGEKLSELKSILESSASLTSTGMKVFHVLKSLVL